jgi:DNA-binding protein HU-beta
MNKGELVKEVVARIGGTEKKTAVVLDAIIESVTAAVASGDKVVLVGFGTFEPRERQMREGRNPKTGEAMIIPATTYPAFSAGKHFKDSVANGEELEKVA